LKEGIPAGKIFVTGNTVIDALKFIAKKVRVSCPNIPSSIRNAVTKKNGGGFVLITGHRRENFGRGLSSICKAIIVLADKFPNVRFVYAIHLNPNVRSVVFEYLGSMRVGKSHKNVHLIEPVPYPSFVFLMDRCRMVLTDSGGIQEEASSLGKPVLIMRDTTERPEVLRVGAAKLIGTNERVIVREVSRLLTEEKTYSRISCAHNLYGNGDVSKKILAILLKKYPVRKPC
jgi:UDP-N-acetylglucosamine 2-epimerase